MTKYRRMWFMLVMVFGVLASMTPPASAAVGDVSTVATGLAGLDGLVFDEAGNLYVSAHGGGWVIRIVFDDAGVASAREPIATGLALPHGLAFDEAGNLYVAEYGGSRVSRIVFDDAGVASAPERVATGLAGPFGLAFDEAGNLYVAEYGGGSVSRIVFDDAGVASAPERVATGLAGPYGLVFDEAGDLYVAEQGGNRVSRIVFDDAGVASAPERVATGLARPHGLVFDEAGNLYVAETVGNRVSRIVFDDAGVASAPEPVATGLAVPTGLVFDEAGNLYVGEFGGGSVSRIVFDDVAPTITIDSTDTAVVGDRVTATFTCTDTDPVLSCDAALDGVAVASGILVDTGTPGIHTLAVTSTDSSGNTATLEHTITVTAAPVSVPADDSRVLTGEYENAFGTAGTVARLYIAMFGRQPDDAGHTYWVNQIGSGTVSAAQVMEWFAASPEAQLNAPDANNTEFIDIVYNNVFHRTPDSGGRTYWVGLLDQGLTRGEVLYWVSESDEFKAVTHSN